jgi:small subunit ribosomal protein S9
MEKPKVKRVKTRMRSTKKGGLRKDSQKTRSPHEKTHAGDEEQVAVPKKKISYLFAVGKRKTAIARIRLYRKGNGQIVINGKSYKEYFPTPSWQSCVLQPLNVTGFATGDFSIKVSGGGVQSQAESIRHGIARALLLHDPQMRKVLKPAGLLTRDARVKERKKYGLKRARRAPQWQKR